LPKQKCRNSFLFRLLIWQPVADSDFSFPISDFQHLPLVAVRKDF